MSGPRTTMEMNGERFQSTISVTISDAMTRNGSVVE